MSVTVHGPVMFRPEISLSHSRVTRNTSGLVHWLSQKSLLRICLGASFKTIQTQSAGGSDADTGWLLGFHT